MLTFDVEKTFEKDMLPVLPMGSTYPYTFGTAIPFEINIHFSARQISDGKIYQIDVYEVGNFTGYSRGNAFSLPEITLDPDNNQVIGSPNGGIFSNVTGYQREYLDGTQTAYYEISAFNSFAIGNLSTEYYENFKLTMTTSLPVIFRTQAQSIYYTEGLVYWEENAGAHTFRNLTPETDFNIKSIYNAVEDEEEPDGLSFTIRNSWTHGIWTNNQQPPVSTVNWRCLRGKVISGRFCLYRIAGIDNGVLKYGIMSSATFYNLEVSDDGTNWTSAPHDLLPFSFFYRPRVNELGEFDYGLTFENDSILIFSNEQDAEDYDEDGDNAQDAENWDEVSDNYPPAEPIGDPDTEPTEMGEIYTRAFFSQQYICSADALQEISNALFDTDPNGLWEDIKKGLEMYGDSPVDGIQGCMFFPFALDEVFTNTMSQNYIYFGGYKFDFQNSSVKKILYPNGKIDFGSWYCSKRFGGSFRDFAPYRRLYCYLPYIGWMELDIKRYLGTTVSVTYYVDTRTGGCMACLFADGILYDYFNGQMGISMPITATDFVAYANAQINTLLGGADSMKNNAGTIGQAGVNMVSQGASVGATALGLAPVAGLAVGAGTAKTLYGLTQNNINNFNVTKGGSSSMLNGYLPQSVMFLDEVQDGKPTPNELRLMGYPSNASGNLQNFSGYLECDAVNLKCDTATENERAEILAYLKSGVYI